MKKTIILALSLFSFLFMSCEGPVGPMGPQGPEGEPGINILGQAFEIQTTFTAKDNYGFLGSFPKSIGDKGQLFDGDVILVYILEGNSNGMDIWEQIPTVRFMSNGRAFQYGFNFTYVDYEIFIEGNFNLAELPTNVTNNKVFRIVVVPADLYQTLNTKNMREVIQKAHITEADVVKL